ncbi:MAG: histone deacetylase family protein [Desulforhopalus sp.]
MRVYFHPSFYDEYTGDPAAEIGRMEAIVNAITQHVEIVPCNPADEDDILRVHTREHVADVQQEGLYDIAALAAGGAIEAALWGMKSPSFGLIRPPGHHASADRSWGFCYFNNMAVSLYHLRSQGLIETAFILDFDLHYGDGNVNILDKETWVEIMNPVSDDREAYLKEVKAGLDASFADVIAVSAGFDHHVNDWGGLLYTADYKTMGEWVREAADRNGGGCYGILEGGYNHQVLGKNVLAFIEGLQG